MIVHVRRRSGETVKTCGKVVQGELVEDTDTYFVIKRINEIGTWTFSAFGKENALYEVVRNAREV